VLSRELDKLFACSRVSLSPDFAPQFSKAIERRAGLHERAARSELRLRLSAVGATSTNFPTIQNPLV
jgi:hypothetical protein